MLIDAHCHFNAFSSLMREEIFSLAKNHCFIDSSIDWDSSAASMELSQKYQCVYSSLGFHPFNGENFSSTVLNNYDAAIAQNKKVVAIGEIGLDYKANVPLEKQKDIFGEFVRLAVKNDLAVIIHNRFLAQEGKKHPILDTLDRFVKTYGKVVFHCFSYSSSFMNEIIDRGGYVSFSLNILRNKSEIVTSLKQCPLDNLLLETDSPYMKIKDKSSTPLDIQKVYAFTAAIKGIDEGTLKERVYSNVKRLFAI